MKVITPKLSACVQPVSEPGPPEVGVPVLIVKFTVDESAVTTFPPASSTVSFGCVGNATPPVELAGCAVKTIFVAGPATTKELLVVVGLVRAGVDDAFSVNEPAVPSVILQFEKVATPAVGVTAPVQPLRVPVPELMVKVIVLVAVVTTSPLASSIDTWGAVVNTEPPVLLVGWTVKTSLLAPPATVNDLLLTVGSVRVESVAFSVNEPAVPSVILQPAKVAVPAAAVTDCVGAGAGVNRVPVRC